MKPTRGHSIHGGSTGVRKRSKVISEGQRRLWEVDLMSVVRHCEFANLTIMGYRLSQIGILVHLARLAEQYWWPLGPIGPQKAIL